jgi:iron complex outermembrane receptor protein
MSRQTKKFIVYAYLLILLCIGKFSFSQVDSVKLSYFEMPLEDLLKMEVTTVSKNAEKSGDAPATIYVINEEQIAIRGYTSLEEVLEDIPEIEVQKKASVEFSNYFTFRGISGSERFVIMMDGVRINSATGTPLPIVHNYPVADAKQIEVVLGPTSAVYGVDAFMGVVNIITKKGYETKGTKVHASYGMYNTTDNSIVLGVGNKDVSFMLSGSFYHSDEPFYPDIYKEDYTWYHERYKTNGGVLLGDDTISLPIHEYETPTNAYAIHAKLNVGNFEMGYFRNYESHCSSISVKPEYSVYSKEASFREFVESMYTTHNFTSNNEKWNFNTSLSYRRDEIDPKSLYINSFTGYNKGYKFGFNKSVKLEEQINFSITENTILIGGLSFEDFNSLAKSGDLPFPFDRKIASDAQGQYYLGTNVIDTTGNSLKIMQDFYYLQYQNFGAFLQFHSQLGNQFKLSLGVRYDYNTRYEYTINPRIGLVYSPLESMRIKLLYGRAFMAPSPYSAYQHYGSFIPVTDSISGQVTGLKAYYWRLPETNLRAQKIRTYELSYMYLVNTNLVLSINAFYNDMIDLLKNQGYTGEEFHGIPVDYMQRPINKGKAKTYGGTAMLSYKMTLSKLKLNSYLAYSYVNGDVDGEHIPFSAENTIKGGIDIKLNSISFSPRFIYRSESKHRSIRDENGDILTSDPYLLLNFMGRYSIPKVKKMKSSIYLKISNLLNNKYYNVPIGGNESIFGAPQDPIRINLGVEIQF